MSVNYSTPCITDDCINCGACVPECAEEAIFQTDEKCIIDASRCVVADEGCGSHPPCTQVCPVDCIEL